MIGTSLSPFYKWIEEYPFLQVINMENLFIHQLFK